MLFSITFIVTAKTVGNNTVIDKNNIIVESVEGLDAVVTDIDGIYVKYGIVGVLKDEELIYYGRSFDKVYVYADWVNRPTIYNNKIKPGFIKEQHEVLVLPLDMKEKIEDGMIQAELNSAFQVY